MQCNSVPRERDRGWRTADEIAFLNRLASRDPGVALRDLQAYRAALTRRADFGAVDPKAVALHVDSLIEGLQQPAASGDGDLSVTPLAQPKLTSIQGQG